MGCRKMLPWVKGFICLLTLFPLLRKFTSFLRAWLMRKLFECPAGLPLNVLVFFWLLHSKYVWINDSALITTRLITIQTHVLLPSTGNIVSHVIPKLLWYFCQFTLSRTLHARRRFEEWETRSESQWRDTYWASSATLEFFRTKI